MKTQATRSQPPAGPSVRRYEAEASTLDGHIMRGAIGADERFLGLRRDNSVNSREGIPRLVWKARNLNAMPAITPGAINSLASGFRALGCFRV